MKDLQEIIQNYNRIIGKAKRTYEEEISREEILKQDTHRIYRLKRNYAIFKKILREYGNPE